MKAQDLQAVLDAVLEGVVVVDEVGRVAHLNAEACRILETSADQAEGDSFDKLVGSRHPLATVTRQVSTDRRAAVCDEVEIERRYQEKLEVDAAISPLERGGGVVIALRDHTRRNSLRDRSSEREQLARYGQIAAGIAHEVKNPLGGIRGAGELLASWSENDRAKGAAELIVREVDRITSLVDELMVFARGDELRLAPLNLHRVLDSVLQLLDMDPISGETEIERNYDPSIPEVLADGARLTQVFLNLARNALQAMEQSEGPALCITTRVAIDDRVADQDGRQVPTVIIEVRDSGPGIAAEELERISTPFYTTRSEGVGLGLAVARNWIARHEGSLRITSDVGVGTTARVALPLAGPEALRGRSGSKANRERANQAASQEKES